MKITEVRPLVLGAAWRNLTFVVVRTDEGISGVGEVRMINHTSALLGYLEEAVPTHVIGADPFAIEALARRMIRDDYARAGQIAMSALAVIEMACWDIMGKALGQPVYRLLGGPIRERIPTYANGWYTVERTPAEFRDAVAEFLEAVGARFEIGALLLDPVQHFVGVSAVVDLHAMQLESKAKHLGLCRFALLGDVAEQVRLAGNRTLFLAQGVCLRPQPLELVTLACRFVADEG